jgi:retinol dehydrogenase 14
MSLHNKTVLVTGSTDGIGKQTALELARMGAIVIIHGRDAHRVKSTMEEIHHSVQGAKLESVIADFSSLNQVRQMAEHIQSQFPRLDVLINNAGVYMKKRVLSEDGYEMTFAVNHLAHFLLTNLLLESIRKSSPARIITVSSMVHSSAKLDFNNLNAEKHFAPYAVYALSKLANILFANELAERLSGTGVTSNSLHPGAIDTKMLREAFNMSGASIQEGAATPVYLATSNEIEGITGQYFVHKQAVPFAVDPSIQKKFWGKSKELVHE